MEKQLFTVEGFKIDDLSHSGVKGQKWGVRKYQNPDGSLTPLGKIHYGGQKIKKSIETKFNITPEKAAHYQAVGKKVMKVAVPVGVGVAGLSAARSIYARSLMKRYGDLSAAMLDWFGSANEAMENEAKETAKGMQDWLNSETAKMDAKYDAAVKESEANWEQSHKAFEEFGRKNGLADFGDFAKRKR